MDAADDLDAARLRFPVGDVVTGRVVHVPQVGVIGLFVDLGGPPTGFVDVLHLPRRDEDWPEVGATATFEVLQHRPGQVRLWPLGGAIPPPPRPRPRTTDEEWATRKARRPVGSEVTATVTEVFSNGRQYVVQFGDDRGSVEWRADEQPPTVGDSRRYRLVRHLDTVQHFLLAPVDPSSDA